MFVMACFALDPDHWHCRRSELALGTRHTAGAGYRTASRADHTIIPTDK